jgi:hypothetical protein
MINLNEYLNDYFCLLNRMFYISLKVIREKKQLIDNNLLIKIQNRGI